MINSILEGKLPTGTGSVVVTMSVLKPSTRSNLVGGTWYQEVDEFDFRRLKNHLLHTAKLLEQVSSNAGTTFTLRWKDKTVTLEEGLYGARLTIGDAPARVEESVQCEIDAKIGKIVSGAVLVDAENKRFLIKSVCRADCPFKDKLAELEIQEILPSIQYGRPETLGESAIINENELERFRLEQKTQYSDKIWMRKG